MHATWQRCRVHFMRNVMAHAGKSGRRVVSAFMSAAFAQDDADAAKVQWRKVADQLRPKLPKLAGVLDDAETDVLAYMTFPAAHRAKLHSTNPIERLNGEIKRRTETVGIFPNDEATYSRYADDITFSTSRKEFPAAVALPVSAGSPKWALGDDLTKVIQKAGFTVNNGKTRMQFGMSRQLVTGLTVNTKVNIRPEYYRHARAMCHRLFATGGYHRPAATPGTDGGVPEPITSLGLIGGILSHIHHVKNTNDDRKEPEKRKDATAFRKLYARFLKYRYFVRLERPLIICEGKTDNIYLKYAIRSLVTLGARPTMRQAAQFRRLPTMDTLPARRERLGEPAGVKPESDRGFGRFAGLGYRVGECVVAMWRLFRWTWGRHQ